MWLRLKDGVVVDPGLGAESQRDESTTEDAEVEDLVLDSTPSAVEHAEQQAESLPIASASETYPSASTFESEIPDDPTFRIGSLPAANKNLVVVGQADQLIRAVTLMLQHDFAQHP